MVRLFNSQKFSLSYLLVFLLLLGNIGCQKEMSKDTLGSGGVVGGGGGGSTTGGSAVFALVPSGSKCSDAAVVGQFEAGTALGADALLTVTVNVTKTGDWTYSTAASNGFSFVGAGNFTTTGPQVITLNAIGKPVRGGIFSYSLKIGNGADCSVPVVVGATGTGGTGGGGGGNTITGEYYYKFTLGGTNYSQDVTSTNGYIADYSNDGAADATFEGDISYGGSTPPANETQFVITKGILPGFATATQAQFKDFFKAAPSVPYAAVDFTTQTVGPGISIYWTQPGGTDMWVTGDGGTMQTGSTFSIVSSNEVTDASGTYLKVKVQFACKLYSVSSGGAVSKALTNGEAVLKFALQ